MGMNRFEQVHLVRGSTVEVFNQNLDCHKKILVVVSICQNEISLALRFLSQEGIQKLFIVTYRISSNAGQDEYHMLDQGNNGIVDAFWENHPSNVF